MWHEPTDKLDNHYTTNYTKKTNEYIKIKTELILVTFNLKKKTIVQMIAVNPVLSRQCRFG